jgi:hypothetical protein
MQIWFTRKLLWRIDPLLCKDLEQNSETAVVAMQRSVKHAYTITELLMENVLCNPLLGSCNSWTTEWKRVCCICDSCREVILKTTGVSQLVESKPVKRRLGGWYEMAASLGKFSSVQLCTEGCEDRI